MKYICQIINLHAIIKMDKTNATSSTILEEAVLYDNHLKSISGAINLVAQNYQN